MIFVEFVEAIVRVAEKCEIPHCVLDEFTWGDDEIDPRDELKPYILDLTERGLWIDDVPRQGAFN